MLSRRGFFTGLVALVAAPAIVRITSIMPVKAMPILGPVEEEIGITNDFVFIDGKFQRGPWRLFGIPTGRNFTTFDYDYPGGGEWKTFQGNWEEMRKRSLEGTPYRVERVRV
jgi:hypothetical protein